MIPCGKTVIVWSTAYNSEAWDVRIPTNVLYILGIKPDSTGRFSDRIKQGYQNGRIILSPYRYPPNFQPNKRTGRGYKIRRNGWVRLNVDVGISVGLEKGKDYYADVLVQKQNYYIILENFIPIP